MRGKGRIGGGCEAEIDESVDVCVGEERKWVSEKG